MSWLVQILPMIDRGGLFQQIDFDQSAYSSDNVLIRGTMLPTFICPSDDRPLAGAVFISNYAGLTGGDDVPVNTHNNGLFFLNSSISGKQIRDGASNTIMVGERRSDDIQNEDLGWMSGTSATLRNTGMKMNPSSDWSWNSAQNAAGYESGTDENAEGDPPGPDFASGGLSSPHTGGSQVALADGSVRFISINIGSVLYRNLGNREDGEMMDEF